ncbi:ATP-binding cassette domain-containing protein [Clostridium botulinum]
MREVGLVGLNGAGKSILANIIYGNIKPYNRNVF